VTLILKRASASRPSGEWNDDDYDVLCDGLVVGRIMKAAAAPVGAVDVDARVRLSRGPHANARLRADARGRHGGVRKKLAVGVVLRSGSPLSGASRKNIAHSEPYLPLTQAVIRRLHSALVTDRAMEAWYHPSIA